MAASDSTYLFHQQEVSLLTTISPGEGCAFSEAPWYVADAHTLRVDGIQGVGQPYVLAGDDAVVGVLLLAVIVGIGIVARSWHYMQSAVTDFFYPKKHTNIYDAAIPDKVLHSGWGLYSFVVLSVGLLCYVLFGEQMLVWSEERLAFTPMLAYLSVRQCELLAALATVAVAIVVKVLVYQYINSTFFTKAKRREWQEGVKFVFLLTALLSVLLLTVTVFALWGDTHLLLAAFLIIGLAKLLLLIKAQMSFFPQVRQILYLILYFCTLEIVPMGALLLYLLHR